MPNLRTPEEAEQARCCGPEGCGREIAAEKATQHQNRWPHGGGRYCIAEACQAWRIVPRAVISDQGQRLEVLPGMPGYCGLAGTPEA